MAGDPRIRGEHEDKRYADWDRAGSSPHTRGARRPDRRRYPDDRIIPAYAGSTNIAAQVEGRSRDHPRIRGEHMSAPTPSWKTGGSSPHTRGAPPRSCGSSFRPGIIPAYAGSTRAWRRSGTAPRDHPRIRGEHDTHLCILQSGQGSSPHTRGAPVTGSLAMTRSGIIPAYAGSTTGSAAPGISAEDHPRIRGEHPLIGECKARTPGSSPHTRGAPARRAGATAWSGDHPRIRGEHATWRRSSATRTGSSPHTRGAREHHVLLPAKFGIIPAYAGSTRFWCHRRPRGWDHPRIRGEHDGGELLENRDHGSSPHTRGAHPAPRPGRAGDRIIPAYAGSTRRAPRRPAEPTDHPRIRGEHDGGELLENRDHGSSPHTRGARRRRRSGGSARRIIPAYAGSTACTRMA